MVTDPIGLNGGLNLYAYVPNPLSWIDPLGLFCGTAKNAKWNKARQNVDGPGLRDHFEKHGSQVGANSVKEYDISARTTIQNGRKFTYRDRYTNKPRVGYYDPETGDSMTFDSSNRIDRRSQRGAGDPYTGEVVGCETNESGISAAYGTTKIYTTDTRARWLHGGGSSLRDPYAPRQGWKPTMGCTRAQNEDVDELCKKVTSWMYSHPGERIRYERFKTR